MAKQNRARNGSRPTSARERAESFLDSLEVDPLLIEQITDPQKGKTIFRALCARNQKNLTLPVRVWYTIGYYHDYASDLFNILKRHPVAQADPLALCHALISERTGTNTDYHCTDNPTDLIRDFITDVALVIPEQEWRRLRANLRSLYEDDLALIGLTDSESGDGEEDGVDDIIHLRHYGNMIKQSKREIRCRHERSALQALIQAEQDDVPHDSEWREIVRSLKRLHKGAGRPFPSLQTMPVILPIGSAPRRGNAPCIKKAKLPVLREVDNSCSLSPTERAFYSMRAYWEICDRMKELRAFCRRYHLPFPEHRAWELVQTRQVPTCFPFL